MDRSRSPTAQPPPTSPRMSVRRCGRTLPRRNARRPLASMRCQFYFWMRGAIEFFIGDLSETSGARAIAENSKVQNSIKSSKTGQANEDYVFAADLGGTHLRAATIDREGRIIHRLKQRTPVAARPEDIVCALVSAARDCQTLGANAGDNIRALAIVVPGSVNVKEGIVVKAPN